MLSLYLFELSPNGGIRNIQGLKIISGFSVCSSFVRPDALLSYTSKAGCQTAQRKCALKDSFTILIL